MDLGFHGRFPSRKGVDTAGEGLLVGYKNCTKCQTTSKRRSSSDELHIDAWIPRCGVLQLWKISRQKFSVKRFNLKQANTALQIRNFNSKQFITNKKWILNRIQPPETSGIKLRNPQWGFSGQFGEVHTDKFSGEKNSFTAKPSLAIRTGLLLQEQIKQIEKRVLG